MTIEDIKDSLRKRLIEHDGNIEPHHLVDIIAEAKTVGLQEKDIAKLVPELDRSINWAAIKEEKRIIQEAILAKEQEQNQLIEQLDALIELSFSNDIVDPSALTAIFNKSEQLQQDDFSVAIKIIEKIKEKGFKSYPKANLSAKGTKEVLLSTSWYDAAAYVAVTQPKPQKEITPKPEKPTQQVPKIHFFEISKSLIKKGESITISWKVSGVDSFTISGFGKINLLEGKFTINPETNSEYILDAGGIKRSVSVTVENPFYTIIAVLVTVAIIFGLCTWGTIRTKNEHTSVPANETYVNHANNISLENASLLLSDEKEKITTVLFNFYKENNNNTVNISNLCFFFTDTVKKYYKDSLINQAKLYKKINSYFNTLSAHNIEVQNFTFVRRTLQNDYILCLQGIARWKLKKGDENKTAQVKDTIILNDHYKIAALYSE